MTKCKSCDTEIPDGATVCPNPKCAIPTGETDDEAEEPPAAPAASPEFADGGDDADPWYFGRW